MELKEFIEGFENAENKDDYVKSHIVVDYVPYEIKVSLCENIIKVTSYDKDNRIKLNSPARFMIFMLTIIDQYTDVDIDFKNATSQFNEFNKLGLVNMIPAFVKESEFDEFSTLLSMLLDDFITNETGIENYIDRKIQAINTAFGDILKNEEIANTINNKINELLAETSNEEE